MLSLLSIGIALWFESFFKRRVRVAARASADETIKRCARCQVRLKLRLVARGAPARDDEQGHSDSEDEGDDEGMFGDDDDDDDDDVGDDGRAAAAAAASAPRMSEASDMCYCFMPDQ